VAAVAGVVTAAVGCGVLWGVRVLPGRRLGSPSLAGALWGWRPSVARGCVGCGGSSLAFCSHACGFRGSCARLGDSNTMCSVGGRRFGGWRAVVGGGWPGRGAGGGCGLAGLGGVGSPVWMAGGGGGRCCGKGEVRGCFGVGAVGGGGAGGHGPVGDGGCSACRVALEVGALYCGGSRGRCGGARGVWYRGVGA